MATQLLWTQGGSYSAADDRNLISAIYGYSGVTGPGELRVTPQGGSMNVVVDAGGCVMPGVGGTPAYLGYSDGDVVLAVDAGGLATGSTYRYLVYGAVSGDNFEIAIARSTVNGSAPAVGSGGITSEAVALALITYVGGSGNIVSSMITDLRTLAQKGTGPFYLTSSELSATVAPQGSLAWNLDNHVLYVFDAQRWMPFGNIRQGTSTERTFYGADVGAEWGDLWFDTELSALLAYRPDGKWSLSGMDWAIGTVGGVVNGTAPPSHDLSRVHPLQVRAGSVVDFPDSNGNISVTYDAFPRGTLSILLTLGENWSYPDRRKQIDLAAHTVTSSGFLARATVPYYSSFVAPPANLIVPLPVNSAQWLSTGDPSVNLRINFIALGW